MTPIYVSRANVETVIGITPHALVALAARYKLKAAKLTPRSRPVWLTTEVTAAIEAERASAAAVTSGRPRRSATLVRRSRRFQTPSWSRSKPRSRTANQREETLECSGF